MSETAQVQLPRWQSHKKVWADKIIAQVASCAVDGANRIETWKLASGAEVVTGGNLRSRVPSGQNPVGGYYVRYDDGFESWSPAQAFEEGYTKIEPEAA